MITVGLLLNTWKLISVSYWHTSYIRSKIFVPFLFQFLFHDSAVIGGWLGINIILRLFDI